MFKRYILDSAIILLIIASFLITVNFIKKNKNPPSIILIVVDSLRADHLPCYGYQKNIAPNICEFANGNILFERAISQAPWTKPSVASLFTSLYLNQHRVEYKYSKRAVLNEKFKTLAEVLSGNANYLTSAYIQNFYVSENFGFKQGFEFFNHNAGHAEKIHSALSNFIRTIFLDKPFFLYLHYNDVHYPYVHKGELKKTCTINLQGEKVNISNPKSEITVVTKYLGRHRKYNIRNEPSIYEFASCLSEFYEESISYYDKYFQKLVELLKGQNRFKNTIIILTSDHGEEFLEHGNLIHGQSLYQELVHIPLIIKLPGAKAKRIPEMVELVDIMPTLLDYLNINPDLNYNLQGLSLMPLINSIRPIGRDLIITDLHENYRALIKNDYKYIQYKYIPANKYGYELYDLKNDPREQTNLAISKPNILKSLANEHEVISKQLKETVLITETEVEIDKELIQNLKSLGYM